MTRQPELTVQAVLGTNPVLSHVGEDKRPFCRFRAATTPSVRTADGGWRDGETVWLTAKAWGALAENLAFSLRKGEPALLHGRLSQETWSGERGETTSNVLTLITAGHDLTRGYSRYTRSGSEGAGGSALSGPSGDSASSAPSAASAGSTAGSAAGAGLSQEHWETGASDCDGVEGSGAEETSRADATGGAEGTATIAPSGGPATGEETEASTPPYLLADLEEGVSLPS